MKTLEAEVVIIGGGIPGVAAAYYLAKAGRKVVLLERSEVGGEASGRNGGGVRQQGRDPAELPFAMASVKIWETLDEEVGIDTEYRQWGNVWTATSESGMRDLEERWKRERASGLPVEMLDHKGVEEITGVRVRRVIGGKYCPTDGHANPIFATKAYGKAASRAGARVFEHTPVTGIRAGNGEIEAVLTKDMEVRTGTVVLAAGPWSPEIGRMVGLEMPVQPVRSQLLVTEQVPGFFRQFVIWTDGDEGSYWRPTLNGNIHIGDGGSLDDELNTFKQATTLPVIEHMAKATAAIFPDLAGVSIIRSWSGTIAATPDFLPIIGPCEAVKGLIFATGYSGHGFCLGPISGKLVCELVTTGDSSIPLEEVSWRRFESGAVQSKGRVV